MNNVTHSPATASPTTVKVPATAPVLAKKLFGDADVEACAADTADVEVCGSCPNVEGYVVGWGRAIVVTATGTEDVLEVDRVDLEGWIVDIEGGRASDGVNVDVVEIVDVEVDVEDVGALDVANDGEGVVEDDVEMGVEAGIGVADMDDAFEVVLVGDGVSVDVAVDVVVEV